MFNMISNLYNNFNNNNLSSLNNSFNLIYTNINIESLIYYFDKSIILYTSIINAIIVGMIIIIYSWYNRQGVCNMYIYNISIEIIWTILPIIFICIMLLHSIRTIYINEINRGSSSSYVNIIGNQWYWIYNNIESRISNIGRIIYVDQPLFIHSNTCTSLIISSLDVIHSFSLPVLGIKVDAIPGRINSVNVTSICPGLYIGYCSELCGSGHGFMPINMVVY
jgi:heme/copper-type cytochrome/quinol oxidase subunit 2